MGHRLDSWGRARGLLVAAALAGAPVQLGAAAADEAAAEAHAIEELVVTAQRREGLLQETPIAISAIGAQAIGEQDIRDVTALNDFVPNLRLVPPPTSATGATVSIRGSVAINPGLHIEPDVAMYLDGFYLGKSVGAIFDVADLERIEVLRGPQGTLYGKNTTGGAINLITRRPTGIFAADVRGVVGNYGLRSTRVLIDLPAAGRVNGSLGRFSASLAFNVRRRDGFIDNVAADLPGALPPSSSELGNIDSRSGRVALHWEPNDALDLYYAYDVSRIDQRPRFFQLVRIDPALEGLLGPFTDESRLSEGSKNDAIRDRAKVDGHALTIEWDAGRRGMLGEVKLRSLTGHREVRALDRQDWDGSPFRLLASARDMDYRSISQELQLIGETPRVEYVAGLYYFTERGDTINPLIFPLFEIPDQDSRYDFDNKAWAGYLQIEWTPPVLDDRLRFGVGGRYTYEDKEISRFFALGDQVLLDDVEFGEDYDNFSPSAFISYRLGDLTNAYLRVARGWKAGLFNAESPNPAELDDPVDPEIVTSYELGLKSQLLERRLQVNFAYFYNDLRDLQIATFVPDAGVTEFTNAGKASIQGVEVELMAVPLAGLELTLGYGFQDAEYRRYRDLCRLTPTGRNLCGEGVAPGEPFDAKNTNRFPYTPRHSANAALQYRMKLPLGELMARIDWRYSDAYDIFPDPFQFENTSVGSHNIGNLRLTWDVPLEDAMLSLSAWVRNVTDEHYRVNALEWGPLTLATFNAPRTYGADLRIRL